MTTGLTREEKRAGLFVEGRARQMRRDFVRRQWRGMTVVAVVSLTPAVASAALTKNDTLRGLVLGAAIATVMCLLTGGVVVLSGSATVTLGAWAEEATADALQPLLAHGYRVIHHAGLSYGDIDHFLVGPGGVFVIETKWSARGWDLEKDPYARRAVQQVKREASLVNHWLRPLRAVPVQAVLVLQGAASRGLPESARVRRSSDDVLVVAGDALERWSLGLSRAVLTEDDVDVIASAMEQQVSKRDALEPSVPRSLRAVLSQALVAVASGIAAFYLPAAAHRFGNMGTLVTTAAITAAAVMARSNGRWRWASTAALASCAFWAALLLITGAIQVPH
jgi:hypothetical protein